MKNRYFLFLLIILLFLSLFFFKNDVFSQEFKDNPVLDEKVKNFLDSHNWGRGDMNVPESDGKLLYGIIIKNGYKKPSKLAHPQDIQVSGLPGHSVRRVAN